MLLSLGALLMSHPKQLIDKKELTKLVKYSPQHIARLEKAGQFPKRLQLGQNRVAWLLTEVEEWIEARVERRNADQLCEAPGSS
ncbi:MAG: AlpA family phage regulatory protein [Cyanobacteria bacterium J06555_12]